VVNAWKVILATIVIFGAGVITGGLLVSHADRAKERRIRRLTGPGLPSWHPQRKDVFQPGARGLQPTLDRQRMDFVLSVHQELKLTAEQRERIEKIVREGQEKTKALWEKVTPQLRKELQDVRDGIRAELTPKQRARFEELLKQRPPHRSEESPNPERRGRDRRQPSSPRDALPPDEALRPAGPGNPPPPSP